MDPDGRETYGADITKNEFEKISGFGFKPTVDGKTWEEAKDFFKEHPDGFIYRNPDEVTYRFYANEGEANIVDPNACNAELVKILVGSKLLTNFVKKLFSRKSDSNKIDDFLSEIDFKRNPHGVKLGHRKGNIEALFRKLTKGGKRLDSGAYELSDGTIIHMHNSVKDPKHIPTLDIKFKGKIYKIRVEP
ncbi:hypothetical protein [Treponema zioleckii]|uniref:hypothetical protein n=1 Tax=Treponema zioleckii TaxID=331680 RepID=UPI00168C0AEC|nr:hypothetical protein [Treponema zioleckii]